MSETFLNSVDLKVVDASPELAKADLQVCNTQNKSMEDLINEAKDDLHRKSTGNQDIERRD